MATDIIARGLASKANNSITGIEVGGAPYIQNDVWYIWDKTTSTYIQSDIRAKGNGILRIEITDTIDLTDTYTIFFEDGSTTQYQVKNGEKGKDALINGVNSINISEGENITITETADGIEISSTGGGSGLYGFSISETGYLELEYEDGTTPSEYSINENGELEVIING